eukprot:scaffold85530_cov100-Phaeocystis_antarctica.AAC.2
MSAGCGTANQRGSAIKQCLKARFFEAYAYLTKVVDYEVTVGRVIELPVSQTLVAPRHTCRNETTARPRIHSARCKFE